MFAGIGPISPIPTEGDGSLVWALVAFGAVVVFLALTWFVRLWGSRGATVDEEPTVSEHVGKRAKAA
jgi:hypothetical protein